MKMKTAIFYISIFILLGMAITSCAPAEDNNEYETEEQNPEDANNIYWYYSYEAEDLLTPDKFGMTAGEFSPYTVAHWGDTLFVANSGTAGYSVFLFSMKSGRTIKNLKTWIFKGEEKSFNSGSSIDAIVPTGNRLYVVERQSLIHVFSMPSLEYISCIGDGVWSHQVFQAQAMIVKDGLIFARDKDSNISIYKETDVTQENYQNVNRWKQAKGTGSANNSFMPHSMVINEEGNIMLTDYESRCIRTLNTSLVTENMENGNNIDIDSERITTDFKPKTFAINKDKIYVTGDNNIINVYDRKTKQWGNGFNSINGYTFGQPIRIYAQNDSVFWISDIATDRQTVVKMVAYKNKVYEYNKYSK